MPGRGPSIAGRLALLALLAAAASARRAAADGLSASALGVTDGWRRNAGAHAGATVGSDGAAIGFTTGGAFEYISGDWMNPSIEAGAGVRFHLAPPLQVYAAAGGIVDLGSDTRGGGRLVGGISATLGDRLFVRPGAAISFGLIGSRLPPQFLLPIEASLEVGFAWKHVSVYARLAGGADPLAPPGQIIRASASAGVCVPVG